MGAAYYGQPDKLSKNAAGTSREDWNAWVLKAGYGQDNWSVGGWFSKDNASDAYDVADDEEKFGISGTVTVTKLVSTPIMKMWKMAPRMTPLSVWGQTITWVLEPEYSLNILARITIVPVMKMMISSLVYATTSNLV